MKKSVGVVLGLLMMLSLAAAPAFADNHCEGGRCPFKNKMGCDQGKDCDKKGECPIAAKVLKKAGFFLSNKAEIGLSEEQVAEIKAIKLATLKSMIRSKAEMEIFEMELMDKMSQPALDLASLNASIDEASAGWGAGAKATLADYAKLKAVLNEGQMSKAKEIWAKNEK